MPERFNFKYFALRIPTAIIVAGSTQIGIDTQHENPILQASETGMVRHLTDDECFEFLENQQFPDWQTAQKCGLWQPQPTPFEQSLLQGNAQNLTTPPPNSSNFGGVENDGLPYAQEVGEFGWLLAFFLAAYGLYNIGKKSTGTN